MMPLGYVTPGAWFANQHAMGWYVLGNGTTKSQIDYGVYVLQEASVNRDHRHCRIGRITLKEQA